MVNGPFVGAVGILSLSSLGRIRALQGQLTRTRSEVQHDQHEVIDIHDAAAINVTV